MFSDTYGLGQPPKIIVYETTVDYGPTNDCNIVSETLENLFLYGNGVFHPNWKKMVIMATGKFYKSWKI